MQLVSLSLRNYRVFDALDLEIPPGLVGIYGPNGAGKSTLLESILWCLYGRARTGKQEIRTAGSAGECAAEVVFQHEGHHYRIRRWLTGANATVKTRAFVGDAVAADGATEVGKYVRSILGMDEGAFRSSVFAEQKQLAAFSDQTPEARRKLVLQLLGIMPLERARDQARADSRRTRGDYERLAGVLPDLADREARVRESTAAQQSTAERHRCLTKDLDSAEALLELARDRLRSLEETRREFEVVAAEGRAARERRDRATAAVARLAAEMEELDSLGEQLGSLETAAAARDDLEAHLRALVACERAAAALAAVPVPSTRPEIADTALQVAEDALHSAERARSEAQARAAAAEAIWAAIQKQAAHAEGLDRRQPCPLCGQELGSGFTEAAAHRAREFHQAAVARSLHLAALGKTEQAVEGATLRRDSLVAQVRKQRAALDAWTHAQAAHQAGRAAERHARAELGDRSDDRAALDARLRDARSAADALGHAKGRLERRPALRVDLTTQQEESARAEARRQELLASAKQLGFDATAFAAASEAQDLARTRLAGVRKLFEQAQQALAHADAEVTSAGILLQDAQAQHSRLRAMEGEVTVLSRTADLLQGFRQTVVASIGPRLQTQAAELFGELTAGDYDGLEVDPDTYAIRIVDEGVAYGTERFSGSEIDLANLALRVAISEHIRFHSGGQVGLLVLDEALASLDADRKDRMLSALTRLSGRFRQILVVTHAPEVKEQLPQAIEVVRGRGRRATARLL